MQWTNRVGFVFTLFSEFEMTEETLEQNVGSVAITLSKKRTTIYPSPIYYVVPTYYSQGLSLLDNTHLGCYQKEIWLFSLL